MDHVKKGDGKDQELRDHGIIFLAGEIDDASAERVCKEIIEFNLNGRVDQIQLIVNSAGGSASAGFAIVDLIEWSRLPVYTTGIGMIGSMGLLIFMAGAKGRRVVTPRTSILSHRFSAMAGGSHSQLIACRKEQDLMHERIVDHYLRHSCIATREELEATVLRDVDSWLSVDEAVSYGLVDVVERLENRHAIAGGR
jgi:ATP-dependent Clp protease protease subunit